MRYPMLLAGFSLLVTVGACRNVRERDDFANDRANDTTSAVTRDSKDDVQEFVQMAAASDVAEVQLGTLASQRARNPRGEEFAQMMVRDHAKSSGGLRVAARR